MRKGLATSILKLSLFVLMLGVLSIVALSIREQFIQSNREQMGNEIFQGLNGDGAVSKKEFIKVEKIFNQSNADFISLSQKTYEENYLESSITGNTAVQTEGPILSLGNARSKYNYSAGFIENDKWIVLIENKARNLEFAPMIIFGFFIILFFTWGLLRVYERKQLKHNPI